MSETSRLLNTPDAAEYIGVSYNTMVDYLKMGLLPIVFLPARIKEGGDRGKLRRNRLIDRSDLDSLVERFKTEPDLLEKLGAKAETRRHLPRGRKGQVPERGWETKYS